MATKIVLKGVRLAFPEIWRPVQGTNEKGEPVGEPKFSGAFLFPKDSPLNAEIEAAMLEAAENKWPGKGKAMYQALKNAGKLALSDGDLKSQYAGYEGNNYVNANNVTRPPIRDRDGKTPLVEADGRPYSGCYVNAIVEAWGQDNKWGKRVNFSLMGLQFVRDGEAFSGGAVASDADFEELTEGSDADDLL